MSPSRREYSSWPIRKQHPSFTARINSVLICQCSGKLTGVSGKPAPEANCRLAFFDLTPGVQLELIEPNEAPSVWRDHLNQYGEGIHHIAFQVESGTSDQVIEQLIREFDAVVEQRGIYGDGSGQYIYLSLHKQLACRIELLESFNK